MALDAQVRKAWPNSDWEQSLLAELGFPRPNHHYQHIRYSAINSAFACLEIATMHPEEAEKLLEQAERHLQLHDTYIALLLAYPEFCKDELSRDEGHFPDIRTSRNEDQHDTYIPESEKRLKASR